MLSKFDAARLEAYKKNLELETVNIANISLDVYFKYSEYFGFEIEFVEDITGVQDLMPIISEFYLTAIENELTEIYRKNGWL